MLCMIMTVLIFFRYALDFLMGLVKIKVVLGQKIVAQMNQHCIRINI